MAKKKKRKSVSPQVAQSRDARWRYFGAIGQLRWSLTALRGMQHIPGFQATQRGEIRDIADRIERLIGGAQLTQSTELSTGQAPGATDELINRNPTEQ